MRTPFRFIVEITPADLIDLDDEALEILAGGHEPGIVADCHDFSEVGIKMLIKSRIGSDA